MSFKKSCRECNRLVYSKGLCKYHQPVKQNKKYIKHIDFKVGDLDSYNASQLKKIADYWLRQFLISTAVKSNGKLYCPIKGKWHIADKMHVAHFCDRANMCTRYSLDNCHLISEESNSWDSQIQFEGFKSKHHYEYEMWLRSKIGDKKFEENLEMSHNFCIFEKEDYIKIIKNFKDGCK